MKEQSLRNLINEQSLISFSCQEFIKIYLADSSDVSAFCASLLVKFPASVLPKPGTTHFLQVYIRRL